MLNLLGILYYMKTYCGRILYRTFTGFSNSGTLEFYFLFPVFGVFMVVCWNQKGFISGKNILAKLSCTEKTHKNIFKNARMGEPQREPTYPRHPQAIYVKMTCK